MIDLQDTLPDLMRRATDELDPDSPDLVERGMRRGAVLRRRRRALTGGVAATAVLVAGGAVIGGHLVGPAADAGPQVAGRPAVTSTTPTTSKPAGGTPEQAEQTLRKLLPPGVRVVQIRSWQQRDDRVNAINVAAVLDDGKGRSALDLQLNNAPNARHGNQGWSCADRPERCRVLADGSALSWSQSDEWQARKNDPSGILAHSAVMARTDGTAVAIGNTNGFGSQHFTKTRPKPVFTVDQLTKLVKSRAWRFPAPTR